MVYVLIHIDAFTPAVLLFATLMACFELFCFICFLSATTQRLHHGWILGVETKQPGVWKSVTMMVSCYTLFIRIENVHSHFSVIIAWCLGSCILLTPYFLRSTFIIWFDIWLVCWFLDFSDIHDINNDNQSENTHEMFGIFQMIVGYFRNKNTDCSIAPSSGE